MHYGNCPECSGELDVEWYTPDHDPEAEPWRNLKCWGCGWWEYYDDGEGD